MLGTAPRCWSQGIPAGMQKPQEKHQAGFQVGRNARSTWSPKEPGEASEEAEGAVEQLCPGDLTQKRGAAAASEPLGEGGKEKESAEKLLASPEDSDTEDLVLMGGSSTQNLSGSELVRAQQNPGHIQALKAHSTPKKAAHTQPTDAALDGRCSRGPSHKPTRDTHPRMASCPRGSSGSPCPPRDPWEEQPRGPGSSGIADPGRGRRPTLAVLTEPWQSPTRLIKCN